MTSLKHQLIAASILAMSASVFAADNNMEMAKDSMMDKASTTMGHEAKDMDMTKNAMPAKPHMDKKAMTPQKHMTKKSTEMKDSTEKASMDKDSMTK